jgi:predicted O-methyltransferase YrrM
MYSPLQLTQQYLYYYLRASNGKGHGIHSPFVFDFIGKVLNDRRSFYGYETIEALRKQCLQDETMLEVLDLGAGSAVAGGQERKVAQIARHALKSKKFAQLLFRMVNYYQPNTVLELGTSLGITTSYLGMGNTKAEVISLEGSPAIADYARRNIHQAGTQHVQVITGNFDDTLPEAIRLLKQPDFVFIDGNHRREPTLRYFEQLLPHLPPTSILIFDDIHWSKEMERAWQTILEHPSVMLSVDLFFIGILFFREEFKVKQDFVIRF